MMMDQYASPNSTSPARGSPIVGVPVPPPPLPLPPSSSSLSAPGSESLKLSIALSGVKPTIIQKGPFYLMKQDITLSHEITGATNLMASKGLEHSYSKLTAKKMKNTLSSFLQNLPGIVDTPGSQDNSSLRGIIEKPPVCGKELLPLNQLQLAGFRLHPGPLPEQYSCLTQIQSKKKQKHKKHKYKTGGETPGGVESTGDVSEERERKREKKHKRHEKDAEDRKKKKKEKKKKKNKDDKE
uniref:Mediator of RNA polymerase II transcription subunit 19 n=1 Tax=Caligus clemensi TaxID=344056 RepID=C1C1J2_CALCM|nr:Mediator of RNA polymerase II transcription subunit 19 [Caligus clemensi]